MGYEDWFIQMYGVGVDSDRTYRDYADFDEAILALRKQDRQIAYEKGKERGRELERLQQAKELQKDASK